MSDTVIQWHPGFVAAMGLELKEYRKDLIFEKEYNLNTRPLEIDLLIIKKETSVHISNEIGSFFRGHNILEYKSPEDRLDIDTLFKTLAYSSLYKSYGDTIDEIRADDITMSIIRETRPAGLFRYFKDHGYSVSAPHSGIFYIEGPFPFPTQIIATGELDKSSHIWLNALSKRLDERGLQNLLDKINRLTEKNDIEMADSVLEVSIGANRQMVKRLMGDDCMFEALMEIMEPKLTEVMRPKMIENRIQGAIEMLRNLQYEDVDIRSEIMKQYDLTKDEADRYIRSQK